MKPNKLKYAHQSTLSSADNMMKREDNLSTNKTLVDGSLAN